MNDRNKITIVGAGYVGMSLSILLAQKNDVLIYDINKEKIQTINSKKSPVQDSTINEFLTTKTLSLKGTSNQKEAYKDADFVIVATPTAYDPVTNYFDTKSVDGVNVEV